jgi:hypothetical protein
MHNTGYKAMLGHFDFCAFAGKLFQQRRIGWSVLTASLYSQTLCNACQRAAVMQLL